MTERRDAADADGEVWPVATVVLHRIETAQLRCVICGAMDAECLHKWQPVGNQID